MLQAIIDDNFTVVSINDWHEGVGMPIEPWVQVGMVWDGTTFVRSQADITKELQEGVQQHLDKTVQARNYDNILACCSYANSAVTRFALEGQAATEWRDAVWESCYAILDECLANTRPAPTLAELIAELPTIAW